jgi:hypothetical protein
MSNQPVVTVEDQQSSIQQGISAVEENQQQQVQQQVEQQQQQPHADAGPNMPEPPTQRSNTGGNQIPTDSEIQQQQGNNTEAQANNTNNLGFSAVPQQQQQAVSATTSQGVTAPKPKVDHTQTDATIQGLLVQVIALQHNKIQQIASQQNQE